MNDEEIIEGLELVKGGPQPFINDAIARLNALSAEDWEKAVETVLQAGKGMASIFPERSDATVRACEAIQREARRVAKERQDG